MDEPDVVSEQAGRLLRESLKRMGLPLPTVVLYRDVHQQARLRAAVALYASGNHDNRGKARGDQVRGRGPTARARDKDGTAKADEAKGKGGKADKDKAKDKGGRADDDNAKDKGGKGDGGNKPVRVLPPRKSRQKANQIAAEAKAGQREITGLVESDPDDEDAEFEFQESSSQEISSNEFSPGSSETIDEIADPAGAEAQQKKPHRRQRAQEAENERRQRGRGDDDDADAAAMAQALLIEVSPRVPASEHDLTTGTFQKLWAALDDPRSDVLGALETFQGDCYARNVHIAQLMGSSFIRDAVSNMYVSVDDGIAAIMEQLLSVKDIAERRDGEGDIACLCSICVLLDVQGDRKGAGLEALTRAQKLGSRSRAYVPCPGDGIVGALMRLDAAMRAEDPRVSRDVVQPALSQTVQQGSIRAATGAQLRDALQRAAQNDYKLLFKHGVVRSDVSVLEKALDEFADALEYHDDRLSDVTRQRLRREGNEPRDDMLYDDGYEQHVLELAQGYRDARADLENRKHGDLLPADVDTDDGGTFGKLTTRELQEYIRDMVYERMPTPRDDSQGDVDDFEVNWGNDGSYKEGLNQLTPDTVAQQLQEEFGEAQTFDNTRGLQRIRAAIKSLKREASGAAMADDGGDGARDEDPFTESSDERADRVAAAEQAARARAQAEQDEQAREQAERSLKDAMATFVADPDNDIKDLTPDRVDQATKTALGSTFKSTFARLKRHVQATTSLQNIIEQNGDIGQTDIPAPIRTVLGDQFLVLFDHFKAVNADNRRARAPDAQADGENPGVEEREDDDEDDEDVELDEEDEAEGEEEGEDDGEEEGEEESEEEDENYTFRARTNRRYL